ncbi:MAG: hypothetical protein U9N61_02260 [Euryarchaeota archaeon]|nr:hypothetical protein [Euryarchaeota archaeon]
MTIKSFCDVCGKELGRNYVSDRLNVRYHYNKDNEDPERGNQCITCNVEVGVNNTWNKGEICKECLLKALTEGEDIEDT